jgi:P2-related tail formation protein
MYKSQELEGVVSATIKEHIRSMITTGMLDDIKKKTVQANKDVARKIEIARRDIERWVKAKENSNAELMKIMMGEETAFNREQITEIYEKATNELERVTRVYAELEAVMKNEGANEVDVLRLQDLLNNWDDFLESATTEIKRQMIRAIVSKVQLQGTEITVEIAFDVAMYLDSISVVKGDKKKPAAHTADTADASEAQDGETVVGCADCGNEDCEYKDGSCQQYGDGRRSDGC